MPKFRGILPIVSLAGFAFAAYSVFSVKPVTPAPPAIPPPRAPYESTVAGTGILEPAAAKITAIGAPFPGLVMEVYVEVGAVVKTGDKLFHLDDRALLAQRAILEARVAVAEADVKTSESLVAARESEVTVARARRAAAQTKLDRLLALPRAEEIPPLEARVAEAKSGVDNWTAQLTRMTAAKDKQSGVISEDDLDRRRFSLEGAAKALVRAEADLALARAGAWAPDVAEAKAAIAEAEGQIAQAESTKVEAGAGVEKAKALVTEAKATLAQNAVEVARATVRSPGPATIFDVNVRAGEYAGVTRDALVVLGDLTTLLVRADIDEESVPMVKANAKAKAVVRGFPNHPFELEFVRIEPYVRPKKSLTGATNERVDTRVLQVIFKAGPSSLPIYVGQQVDVFMEGAPRPGFESRAGAPAATTTPGTGR